MIFRHQIFLIAILLMAMRSLQAQAQEDFPYPSVPAELTTPQERADYVVRHYWDNINFQDTTLIHRPGMIEQGFVNFIDLLPHLGKLELVGWQAFTEKALGKNATYDNYLKGLAERYLYTATSPMRNDSLYCHLLAAINQLPTTSEEEREKNLFLITQLGKNKVGDVATNFEYTDEKGNKHQLHDVAADYTLLYMYDPDCETCHQVEEEMKKEPLLQQAAAPTGNHQATAHIAIVRVNAMARKDLWKSYYFRSFPTLYLLDKSKRVVLKDTELGKIVSFLRENR